MKRILSSTYLSQSIAINLDKEWFEVTNTTRLMELAGLGVAQCIYDCYPPEVYKKPLIISGPGNNGGDGLVAAKFLKYFGYNPSFCCPKLNSKPYYAELLKECKFYGVEEVDLKVKSLKTALSEHDFVIDTIFGFSFKPPLRPPFDEIIYNLTKVTKPVVSVDIPSGWPIDERIISRDQRSGPLINPETLISITWPKLCASSFTGKNHYLVMICPPKSIIDKYHLDIGVISGSSLYAKIN